MQLFVGRIPNSIRYDEIYDYFSKFGKVKELRLKESYGFLMFEEDLIADKVLQEKHVIDGFELHIEVATNNKRKISGSNKPMSPRYRSRSPVYRSRGYSYRYDSPERRKRRRSPSYTPEWSHKRYRSMTLERSPCSYCDRCEIHGRYEKVPREEVYRRDRRYTEYDSYPANRFKIVLDNLSEKVTQRDLLEFVRGHNLEPTFTRLTANGNHGIVEFSSISEKEEALDKLNGVNFIDKIIVARPYFQRERGNPIRPTRSRKYQEESPSRVNDIYDDIRTAEDWPKNDVEGEWCESKGEWNDGKKEEDKAEM